MELVVVLGILAVLSGIVVLSLTTMVGNAAQSACEADEQAIQTAVYSYYYDNGVWPTATNNAAADIQWSDLVPGYLNETPGSDTDCDWGIETGGQVCADAASPPCGTACSY